MDNEYGERLVAVEQRSSSNSHRIEELERRTDNLSELVTSVKVLALKQDGIETTVKEIKEDVKTITEKPAKRWNDMVGQIIGLVIAAFVTFLLCKLGI